MDVLEKRLLPSSSTEDKKEQQFLQTIKVYDSYQAKLNECIPFDQRVQQTFDFFVNKEEARE